MKQKNIRAVVELKRKTEVEVERDCQEGPESPEHQGRMGH